jgi:hypothetical protein
MVSYLRRRYEAQSSVLSLVLWARLQRGAVLTKIAADVILGEALAAREG